MYNQLIFDKLFFPVDTGDVFTKLKGSDKTVKVPGKKVLINADINKPISVVSSGYEIITNGEALEYGKRCIRTLFELGIEENIDVYSISASQGLTFCNIDLFSKNRSLSVLIKDQFVPFVRVTNSYNSMFRLSFKVGIYRVMCSNGMMFEDKSIEIEFSHVKGAKREINFLVNKESFQGILDRFKTDIQILVDSTIPQKYLFPIFCKALNLNFSFDEDDEGKMVRELERLKQTKLFYENKFKEYKNELGNDNYSLYNVITNAASFGLGEEKSFITKINKRQSRAGAWLASFSNQLKNGNIDYDEYLKGFLNLSLN